MNVAVQFDDEVRTRRGQLQVSGPAAKRIVVARLWVFS